MIFFGALTFDFLLNFHHSNIIFSWFPVFLTFNPVCLRMDLLPKILQFEGGNQQDGEGRVKTEGEGA
jgi:hypothetical protein